MKHLLPLLLLGTLAACHHDAVPVDLIEITTGAQPGPPLEVERPTLVFEGRDASGMPHFRMTNGTGRSFTFTGYSADAPILREEFLRDGEWSSGEGWGLCGTGLDERAFDPGTSLDFTAYTLERPVPLRVIVGLMDKASGQSLSLVSDAVPAHVVLPKLVFEDVDAAGVPSFRLTNDTRKSFTFVGFTADAPVVTEEVLRDNAWQQNSFLRCGTGLGTHAFEPGSSLSIRSLAASTTELPARILLKLTNPETGQVSELTCEASR